MSHHGGNFRTKKHRQNIEGIGISERDSLLSEFARQADLSLKDAQNIVTGKPGTVCPEKFANFSDAASQVYGDLDTFQTVYESLA